MNVTWSIPSEIRQALPKRFRVWLLWMRYGPRRGGGVLGGSALFRLVRGPRRSLVADENLVVLRAETLPRELVVDPTDFETYQHTIPLWLGRSAEHELIRRELRPGDLFLDVGANFGVYSLYAAALARGATRVLAVEPQPRAAEAIRRSASRNGLSGVEVIEAVAGDSDDDVPLFLPPSGSGAASRSELLAAQGRRAARILRPQIRIDGLVATRHLPRFDLMKVDVEGYEAEVFQGARGALARFRPIVWFEINAVALAARGVARDQALGVLREVGYRRFIDLSTGLDVDLSQPRRRSLVNVVAVPEERDLVAGCWGKLTQSNLAEGAR